MVERQLPKLNVAGSIPVSRSNKINNLEFPSSLLALDRFDNEKNVGRLHMPLLIANGSKDEVVPDWHGKTLYALANDPKVFYSLANRGHNDAFDDRVPLSLEWPRCESPQI